jgi:hypothetical protein
MSLEALLRELPVLAAAYDTERIHEWLERLVTLGNFAFVDVEKRTLLTPEKRSLAMIRKTKGAGVSIVIKPGAVPVFRYLLPYTEGRVELSIFNMRLLSDVLWMMRQHYLVEAFGVFI